MASVEELSAAIGGNAEQAREVAGGLGASKEQAGQLAGALAGMGLEGKASEANAVVDDLEKLTGQQLALAEQIEQARARAETLRGLLASTGGASGGPSLAEPVHSAPSPQSETASGSGRSRHEVTKPSLPPDPARRPDSGPTPIPPRAKRSKQIDIQSENDAAAVLARSGYRIEQNPPPKLNGKEPDYFMEGDYWDCYTPHTGNLDQVRRAIKSKVNPKDGRPQADRIVVNLDAAPEAERARFTPAEIEQLLQRKPLANLKELKVIADGQVHDLRLGA